MAKLSSRTASALRKPPPRARRSKLSASIVRPSKRPMPSRPSSSGGSSSAPASRRRRRSAPIPTAKAPCHHVDNATSGTAQARTSAHPDSQPGARWPSRTARPTSHHDRRNRPYCAAWAATSPPPSRNRPAARSCRANGAPAGNRSSQACMTAVSDRNRSSMPLSARARAGPESSVRARSSAIRARSGASRGSRAARRTASRDTRRTAPSGARQVNLPRRSANTSTTPPGSRTSAGCRAASAASTSRCTTVVGSTLTPSRRPAAASHRSSAAGSSVGGRRGAVPAGDEERAASPLRPANAASASPMWSIGHSRAASSADAGFAATSSAAALTSRGPPREWRRARSIVVATPRPTTRARGRRGRRGPARRSAKSESG